MPEVKRVFILFGWSPRLSDDGKIKLDDRHSQRVWDLFLPALSDPSRVYITPVSEGNAMVYAAKMAWDNKLSGERITAGYGDKEPRYGQVFMNIVNSLSSTMGAPAATPVMVPTFANVPAISATRVRNAASTGDMRTIASAVPAGVSPDEYLNILQSYL